MASGEFSHSTLQNLVDQLAQDVSDTAKRFFTSTELERAIVEALRLSNVLTARSRGHARFNTTAGQAWYDLSSLDTDPTLLTPTVTDRTTVENMQYRLMETVEPAAGVGMKEQYTFTELVRTLQQVRDRTLVETMTTITKRAPLTPIATDGVVEVDESIARILRAVWTDQLRRSTILRNPTDEGTTTAARIERRLQTGTPRRWSMIASPQLTLQLDPLPGVVPGGSLQLWTVDSGSALDTTANSNTGTVLGLPDDTAVGAMWGALELLLSKHGMGLDSQRAQLAGTLSTLYRTVAATLPTVLEVTVNDVNVRIGTVNHLDAKDVSWEARINSRTRPNRAVVFGDWLGLYPVPDDSFSVDVTVSTKLQTPALTDYVQIGKEHLSGILAWAKQILLFKVGGQPLAAAAAVAGLLIEQAREYNEARAASCQYLTEFLSQGLPVPVQLPRSAPAPDLSGDPREDASSRNTRQRDPAYSPYFRQIGGR